MAMQKPSNTDTPIVNFYTYLLTVHRQFACEQLVDSQNCLVTFALVRQMSQVYWYIFINYNWLNLPNAKNSPGGAWPATVKYVTGKVYTSKHNT